MTSIFCFLYRSKRVKKVCRFSYQRSYYFEPGLLGLLQESCDGIVPRVRSKTECTPVNGKDQGGADIGRRNHGFFRIHMRRMPARIILPAFHDCKIRASVTGENLSEMTPIGTVAA